MSRILIVDDHPVIRMAMKMLLEAEGHQIVGDTDNGVDAISLGRELKPDLAILDIGIPRLDGLEVISRLMVLALPLKILVLTGQSASLFALRSMQAGAAGFVCKQGGLAELVTAVNAVASGYSYFPSSAMRPVQQGAYSDDVELLGRLSDREVSVLQYLSQGYSNKQISEQMFISNKTVSTYKARLLLKLNAGSLVDLIEFAKRNTLI
ncbi:TPA: response regulator [Pseudomonas aeruginosa]|uniref:response regulator transcription factor n=1 Tax=Pseudomonas aeruginosa TaxID=287 RepID=UPI00053E83EF|nr:response regulator transcription factor [Pseudomonas aeruginosa]QFZ63678.1 response regulator transcription factor [Pseudomonas aeruginosa PA99]ALV79430.1 Virulence factors putative positive transcription regulator BvgA [Pseudomonas aeruginosa]EKV9027968.1 response regulator transcription factor [Pseudomonas aeruginosa]EKW0328007.1 response regulator transcription factor [Pseudomonas aeruginosa]EKW2707044.1 response regulator transcription factor [Pseudomonas aeruginosa]